MMGFGYGFGAQNGLGNMAGLMWGNQRGTTTTGTVVCPVLSSLLSGTTTGTTTVSGLPQTMGELMQGVLAGGNAGATTFTGVMQSMLDAMDDLLASSNATTSTGATALQTMVHTMETVLAGAAGGTATGPTLMQNMLDAMQSVLAGSTTTAASSSAATGLNAAAMPSVSMSPMTLSADGHVLAATMDRAHLTVSQGTGGITVTQNGGQTIHMMGGVDTIVATDGQIMTGLNDTIAGPVWRLYQATLGREPDVPGFQYWMNAVQSGTSVNQVAQSFMASNEFQTKYGPLTDSQFIDQLYHNVLDRPTDAAGLAYWTDQMSHGMTRATVLVGIANSAENIADTAAHAGTAGYWLQ